MIYSFSVNVVGTCQTRTLTCTALEGGCILLNALAKACCSTSPVTRPLCWPVALPCTDAPPCVVLEWLGWALLGLLMLLPLLPLSLEVVGGVTWEDEGTAGGGWEGPGGGCRIWPDVRLDGALWINGACMEINPRRMREKVTVIMF